MLTLTSLLLRLQTPVPIESFNVAKSVYDRQPEGFLETWLHTRNSAVECTLEPIAVSEEEWFHTVKPDVAPNFTLTSAWLKTESASAMNSPKEIPQIYESEFNMGGKVENSGQAYYDQAYLGKTAETSVWSNDLIMKNIEKASKREMMKYYGDGIKIHDGAVKYKSYIEGKRGIVIGSEDPWVEAILLHYGAEQLLTVEFGKIFCEHPQINTMVPKEFTEDFLNGRIKQFDFGMSFSSLEHDGLGRYGDVVNPIGDLQSMAKMLSVIKPGGLVFIAIPTGDGADGLVWNAHRIYGRHRLEKLFAGWKLIDVIGRGSPEWTGNPRQGFTQHLWVLQNLNGCKTSLPHRHDVRKEPNTPKMSSTCMNNPYMFSVNETFDELESNAKEWLDNLPIHLSRAKDNKYTKRDHQRFFPFERMGSCNDISCIGGECSDDTSKIACGMSHLSRRDSCIVYSIGGNNQWEFELDVLRTTKCDVHTFDCTGSTERYTVPENSRLHFHHICLGAVRSEGPLTKGLPCSATTELCGDTWTLTEIRSHFSHKQVDLLKVDIEGWEWPIFDRDAGDTSLPMQLLMEVHYCAFPAALECKVKHNQTMVMASDMVRFQSNLLRSGYVVVNKDDNPHCPWCTELTLIRASC